MSGHEDGEEHVSDGDDASSISDISELVEERLEQQENERISRKAKSNSRATIKLLELVEELEKKHASTVHLNFIAVGMTKSVIILVPNKYSTHHADSMDSKMVILGLQGDRSLVPITSMCFNQPGDLLLASYGDDHITVWDV
ncbi:hypothetical protein V6N13_052674 [Hibiscus sabdariffa]|uniref:Uncharacterized protein n=1 Tax=Hibiscus sabdariffa TaxID=183260 RepID=A0ABR2Q512_9ROSI